MRRRTALGWIGTSALLLASPAWPHHSFAMFDQSKTVTITGTVVEFQWTNPHAFLHLAVEDGKQWNVELNSPNNLRRQGWRADSLKAGDKVTVTLNPLRDGSAGGLFLSAKLPDGTVLGDPTRNGAAAR